MDMYKNNRKCDPLEDVLQWKHPFTCIIAGPSGSGKTEFVLKLINNADIMINKIPETLTWCYGEYQTWMIKYPEIDFIEGLPEEIHFDSSKNNMLIIDDLMHECKEYTEKLFTKISHHKNLSVILLSQNIFHQNKHTRTISLNTHYMVLFKNVRDSSQITNLAKQMHPGNVAYLRDSYVDATSKPYGYLLIDLKPDTDDLIRLRTDIFPGEIHYVYHKKK